MELRSFIDSDAKTEAFFLCRVGEYRKAVALALRAKRSRDDLPTELDLALPTSLIKCGRYRASLRYSLELLTRQTEQSARIVDDLVHLICGAISNFQFSKEELVNTLTLIQEVKLSPIQFASITSHIQCDELRSILLESSILTRDFTPDQLVFINASVLHQRGNDLAAIKLIQDLQAKGRVAKDSALLIATILNKNGNLYYARKYACMALKIDSQDIVCLDVLGQVLYQESKWKATRRIYEIIHQITRDDISMLNMEFTLPAIPLSSHDLDTALATYRRLLASPTRQGKIIGIEQSLKVCSPLCHSFFLAYQGDIHLKELLEGYTSLIRSVCHTIVTDNFLVHSPDGDKKALADTRRDSQTRVKIGFVSKHFSQHSNLQAHQGLISHLDRRLFEILIIHRQGTRRDGAHHAVNEYADQVIYLEDDFGRNCQRIAELRLDILFFTDIGMSPFDNVLAMVRLAPKQVTGWGIPHTTGLREIDYYMRSTIFDDCEDASQYTETLKVLDGYLGYFNIDKADLTVRPREYFMLPPDRFLIGCLQALHKIHPDFDEYLEAIARIDESILIVIAASETDAHNRRIIRRLKRSAPSALKQICFLQKMNMGEYYSLNSILDLNLDTIHYGAGITFIQTAWCGPPCVTQRARTVRASVVSRSYEYAGIENPPIAKSKGDYIAIVEDLMKDDDRRMALRNEIHTKSQGTIYNNTKFIESCQRFFLDLNRPK
ncbi:hypothetical protein KBY82_11695 [Cyanobium sp. AMD-g]|uniref:O-linked N-acetylglucosamine transferase family protein n=1 Tax=Cyanobium sp. AMD-g TaxID=2823699 RepID=UPI0020CD2E91|nr:hypothetical protein [Cyanobium sp. AMD-g]MCP9931445.1 hypothetical protein [Cyanobium sp. AMD-g]